MTNINQPKGNNATAAPETISEQLDCLTAKLTQLSALMEHTYGESSEAFSGMGDALRDRYLWHCADVVRDCHQAAEDIHTQHLAESMAARKIGGAA